MIYFSLDLVTISFTTHNQLVLNNKDATGLHLKVFDGVFNPKGYFEICLSKKYIQIPSLLPILYSKTNISSVRLSVTSDNNIIVDTYYNRGENLYILAAGVSGRSQFYFKKR